jgi:thiamine-phosphate pyrophosphorylase
LPVFCYITDRRSFSGDESTRCHRLLEKIAEATRCGVDYIQLREKDLSGRELETLTREAVRTVRENTRLKTEDGKPGTAVLVNSRTDIALSCKANGVHLRSDDVSPKEVRAIWGRSVSLFARDHSPISPIVSVACHTSENVAKAETDGVDFAIFAPVFEKKDSPAARPAGLTLLRQACQARIPVLALGGITVTNVQSCLEAGAAGIAAIRLFQDNDIAEVVRELRR